jgi:hypothetical protein
VPCVSKVDTRLISALVAPHLKSNNGLARLQFLLGEYSFVFLGFFWSDGRLTEVTSLEEKKLLQNEISGVGDATFLPKDCKQMTTELRFCLSQRSTVWKVSWAGTPRSLAASRKALIFSMHLKAIFVLFTFLTIEGLIVFTNL